MILKILIKRLNQVNLLIKLQDSVNIRFKAEIITRKSIKFDSYKNWEIKWWIKRVILKSYRLSRKNLLGDML